MTVSIRSRPRSRPIVAPSKGPRFARPHIILPKAGIHAWAIDALGLASVDVAWFVIGCLPTFSCLARRTWAGHYRKASPLRERCSIGVNDEIHHAGRRAPPHREPASAVDLRP